MNVNDLADRLEQFYIGTHIDKAAETLRQQDQEIEDLKNANRFIQNFAEEQHQRAVALEMREITDEEIKDEWFDINKSALSRIEVDMQLIFARAILKKASERA